MIRAAIVAAALIAAAPALAAMRCAVDPDYGTKYCEDREAMQREHVALFCRFHPTDANCQKLGWHPTTNDPVEQAVDRRLVEHFCAANPTLARCISPFGR